MFQRAQAEPPAQPQSWLWIGKYLIVIIAALVLGAVLGSLEPFRNATLGSAHVSAGALVQFIAHTGALLLLWALGFRHANQLSRSPGSAAHLASSSFALVTLVVVASFYGVLLHLASPLFSAETHSVVDWLFIAAIISAAGWLLWSLFANSEAALASLGRTGGRRARAQRGGSAT